MKMRKNYIKEREKMEWLEQTRRGIKDGAEKVGDGGHCWC